MLTGYSNAMYDARVWSQTRIHQNPSSYLSPSQYLLGDAAYTPTSHMVPPYKALEAIELRIQHSTNSFRIFALTLSILLGF